MMNPKVLESKAWGPGFIRCPKVESGSLPVPILNHMEIEPELIDQDGTIVPRTYFSGGQCPLAQVCDQDWIWNDKNCSPKTGS
jgi:hypothetical protein